jgi:UDP-GlcNAc:undecaprenyl-phosphate GlcNAc-1-phosphate transferase
MHTLLAAILALVGAFALSVCLVPLAARAARRVGVMDEPGPRKVHARATPRLGGLALFLSFNGVVLAGCVALPEPMHRVQGKLFGLLAGAALAFAIGLADDFLGRRFPAGAKAAGLLVSALVVLASGVRVSFLPLDWMNAVVTVLWLVGITNAFNLLDNMDGLSAGVALVASGLLLVNACLLGEVLIGLVLVAFMGSLLGFLVYNWNPASIFLGDCGSLFVGSVMASLTLLERYVSHASSTYFPVLMPVLVLALPLLDTLTVIVIRVRERRPIYVGDSRHLSHRLVSLGLSQTAAVLVIYLMTLCLGLGALFLAHATPLETLLILLQAGAMVALVLILLFFERRAVPRAKPAAPAATPERALRRVS